MRLVQLSRKLGVTQNEIVDLLSKNGIKDIEGSNAKLDEHALALIMEHFGNDLDVGTESTDSPQNEAPTQEVAEKDSIVQHHEEKQEATAIPKEPEARDEAKVTEEITTAEVPAQEATEEATTNQEVEVIRAKKIKLEGIKVLGKIELPEPVKKERDEPKEKPATERRPRQKRNPGERNGKKQNGRHKRTETYEQKQKRQEKEALRKKKEREKKLKEKRKAYYEQQVKTDLQKPKTSTKPKKKKKIQQAPAVKKKVVYHKNPIKRLWAWLNGRYD
ncbi:hypothetical protein GCM10009122_34470 [Fulvivirga kasyanovii]